ncbi:hypothetical protein EV360DRAFT_58101 [Lentinula raphanica]|nr:hypothetical protein EV360DRAFT_58101 [Lentinula raphanica]
MLRPAGSQSQSQSSFTSESQISPVSTPTASVVRKSHKRPAVPSVPSSSKRLKASTSANAEAIGSLAGALDRFGTKFSQGTQELAAAIHASPERAVRTRQARDILEEKETWLSVRQKIQLGEKFADAKKADSYLYYAGLGSPTRKTWAAVELGIPEPI